MRVVIAEDLALLRDGLTRLLRDNGIEVVAAVGDGDALVREVVAQRPDLAIVDIRLPPGFRDEGLRAALELRRRVPGTAVLVISQYVEPTYAEELLADRRRRDRLPAQGPGHARRRLPRGRPPRRRRRHGARPRGRRTALRPPPPGRTAVERLTPREREVLSLMAEGRSNAGIAEALVLTVGAVEKHVAEHPLQARPRAVAHRPPARARGPRLPAGDGLTSSGGSRRGIGDSLTIEVVVWP